jgi:DNA-binding beta-propeller fold protein YncE
MRTTTRVLALSLLVAGACGGDDAPADPDAATDGDACVELPGHACRWLGRDDDESTSPDGAHRLDTSIYWSMDLIFTADGTAYLHDWNAHLVRKVDPVTQVVTTVVGTGFPGDGTGDDSELSADGADGLRVNLNHPTDFAILPDGGLLLMAWHNHKLRRIEPATGRVKLLAGGDPGFAGDGGPLSAAVFKQPKSLAIDEDGAIYIGDQQNFRVRRVGLDGVIETIVGNGTLGDGGDGGPAIEAQLGWEAGSNPEPSGGLAVGGGKLYIADTLNHRIRVVDLTDATMPISTLAGTGAAAYGGDGGPATAATLNLPRDVELGPDGSELYVADTYNHAIRAIDLTSGVIRTVVGTGEGGLDLEDGKLATETRLERPFGIAFDGDGNLYVADTKNSRILKVVAQ